MATDLTVVLDDRAGQLAHMGEALGDAGVNIEGFCATTDDGAGIVHVLVENAMVAQNALILADIKVEGEADAVVIDLRQRRPARRARSIGWPARSRRPGSTSRSPTWRRAIARCS
jgi:hypothetical protein